MTEFNSSWVEEKFQHCSVAFALTIRNATGSALRHVETHLSYGQIETGYGAPREIEPGSEALIVARNTSKMPTGSSGVLVWRIGSSIFYLVVAWSAPRNFYTHSNTLCFGITNGYPVQINESGFQALFNQMYYDKLDTQTPSYFTRVTCNFGDNSSQGNFRTNRYELGGMLSQEHRSWNVISIKSVMELPEEPVWSKAMVKLVIHQSKALTKLASNPEDIKQNHMILVFEWTLKKSSRDTSIIICELKPQDKVKSDINTRDQAVAICDKVTKTDFIKSKKGTAIKVVRLGEILSCEEDLRYFALNKAQVNDSLPMDERSVQWIMQVAKLLNIPNQDVITVAKDILVTTTAGANKFDNISDVTDGMMIAEAAMRHSNSLNTFNPSVIAAREKLTAMECSI